jgi:hypothetical protein
MADKVTAEREGHLLLIGVNRPDERNARDLDVIRGVAEQNCLESRTPTHFYRENEYFIGRHVDWGTLRSSSLREQSSRASQLRRSP